MARKGSAVEVAEPTPASGDVYTMAEAARLKGVSYHTVSRAVRRGKLPAQRLGRMALITTEDLRDWRPMRERAPKKYRRREPNPDAAPALLDLASGERVALASRLSTLYEMVHSSAAELPLPDFLALLADRLAAALELRRVAIWGLSANGRAQRLASFGPPLSMVAGDVPVSGGDALRDVFMGEVVAVVDDVGALMGSMADELIDVRQMFVAPLRVGLRQLGFIAGDNNGEPFTLGEDQRLLAQGMANQAALAIERAQLLTDERRRAEMLAAVLEHVSESVFASDGDGNLVLVNAAARELLGLGATEVSPDQALDVAAVASRSREFDGRELPLADTPLYRAIRGERVNDREYILSRADGSEVAVRVNARPIAGTNGTAIGAVAVAREIEAPAAASRSAEAAESRR